ncbi:hypothetical protein [Paenibacillus sp. HB172176]|uniref:hypothetical protein n=1 Tax=Paenibacillus sp. HB172176 TaxID=2493690 RepID=UPI001981D4A5|nr:hypothetical protein [Paenibacillus sp. HB172176]
MAKESNTNIIIAGLLLAILMASMDNTIVATAIGTIVGELGVSATNSGLVLLPMMVGTVVTAAGGGQMLTKFKYRSIMIPTLALLVGCLLLIAIPKACRYRDAARDRTASAPAHHA